MLPVYFGRCRSTHFSRLQLTGLEECKNLLHIEMKASSGKNMKICALLEMFHYGGWSELQLRNNSLIQFSTEFPLFQNKFVRCRFLVSHMLYFYLLIGKIVTYRISFCRAFIRAWFHVFAQQHLVKYKSRMSCNDGIVTPRLYMKTRDPRYFSFVSAKCSYVAALYCPLPPSPSPFFIVVCDIVRISDRVPPIVGWWVVSFNLEGMCQVAVMFWFRYGPGICLEGLRKTKETSVFDYKSRAFQPQQPDRCHLPIEHTVLYSL